METDWQYCTLVQLLLWPESWLEALLVDVPARQRVARKPALASDALAVQGALPLDAPEHEIVIDAAFIGRKVQALRNWRAVIQREYVLAGKPAEIKKLLDLIDGKTNEAVERMWQLWGPVEPKAWKKAS